MAIQLPFDVMFDKLLHDLSSSNKVIKISGHFGPLKTIKEMFKYVWNMEETHLIQIASTTSMKDDKKSEEFRTIGNQFYKKKMLLKALEFYNNSIMYSPQFDFASHLSSTSENSVNYSTTHLNRTDSKNLAIAYANRSAVLYELQKYEECLLDIKRSIEYGYPTVLRIKLIEREIKCCLAQKQNDKAKSLLEDGLIFAKTLDLNQESTTNICNNFEKLLNRCENGKFIEENSLSTNHEIFQNTSIPDAPTLSNSNQDIPSLSDAVSLSFVPERGRYLVAERDIVPGEVLISERCFSFITLPSFLDSRCSYCLRRVYIPVPCTYCTSVAFCSEECLSRGMNQFHNIECCILSSLIALELGSNSMLALRLIVQTPLSELKAKVNQYLDGNEDAGALLLGFNESNIYSSEDYRPIYHLVTNLERRSVSDLFKRSMMAACLVKLLLKTNYFGRPHQNLNDIISTDLEDVYFVGNILFIHLMNLPCNAHSITELVVQTSKYQESHIEEIGAGAFGVLSLTNHSCDPSLARSCYGQTIVAKAIKFIPKGSEILDSYGEHFAIRDREERGKYLSHQYYFECACEACSQNWCLYNKLPDYTLMNCISCSNSFPLQDNKCSKCKKFTDDIEVLGDKNVGNMQELHKYIQKVLTLYHNSYEQILKGNLTTDYLENVLNVIYYFSKYSRMPSKILFEAQETLKHCFDRQGLHRNI